MPWDARSCRVFLEIPDKSWCCYLAFDSFPCMEAESSWSFLCSALAHPVLGAGLTPLHHSDRTAQLELFTSQQVLERSPCRSMTTHPGSTAAGMPNVPRGRRVQELPGRSRKAGRAQLSHTPAPHPSWREERSCRPPHPSMDSSQASLTYLHP